MNHYAVKLDRSRPGGPIVSVVALVRAASSASASFEAHDMFGGSWRVVGEATQVFGVCPSCRGSGHQPTTLGADAPARGPPAGDAA